MNLTTHNIGPASVYNRFLRENASGYKVSFLIHLYYRSH